MTSTKTNSITKNTLLLYVRMFFVVIITFYTSRKILEVLGVDDYGIYNVVGGIVTLFTFISVTMSGATSRFITFELGKGDASKVSRVFSAAFTIHVAIAIVVLLIAETLGSYFLEHYLNIAEDRMLAAQVVYQFSILSCVTSIIQTPFQASIIANEKMKVYAIISMIDVTLKLFILYLIALTSTDRLIAYSILLFCVIIIVFFIYLYYCRSRLIGCELFFSRDISLIKPMLSFSSWDLYGNMSSLLTSQGINFLLNVFFGVAVNASIGIATQFNAGINMFSNNFLLAVRPQIVKRYASKEHSSLLSLLYKSSMYSYFLVLIIAVPLFFEIDYVLNFWLTEVPKYLNTFCQIFIIKSLFAVALSSVLTMLIHAVGRMKEISFYRGSIILLTVPVSYIFLNYSHLPYVPLAVNALMDFMAGVYTIYIAKKIFSKFSVFDYIKKVLWPCSYVTFFAFIVVSITNRMLPYSFLRVLIGGGACFIVVLLLVYFCILDENTKSNINSKIKKVVTKYT